MKLYKRNTHDDNGNYRKELYDIPIPCKLETSMFGIYLRKIPRKN